MTVGKNLSFNLVIDEFQEFFYINPSIYSGIQDVWDRYKDTTHVHFIASGSVYTLMHRIFMEYREPLYGRCESIIKLRPFTTTVLKQILSDHHPNYTNDDLLALYTLTGGVPKYIELLLDKGCFTMQKMINTVFQENSKGKNADQNEIDIVAISAESPHVLIAEVKRQRKNFKPELFQQKVEAIRTKLLFNYEIETTCLTLEDR